MATISFLSGTDFTINNLSGSGLGFYGIGGFGYSVPVGQYQSRTFITDSTGTSEGPEVDNVKYLSTGSGILGQSGSGISLLAIPNYLSTLNIRFTHGSAVQTQNVKVYGYDRVSKNNAPSGVTLYGANIRHAGNTQTVSGSGSSSWVLLSGSGSVLTLNAGAGVSGLSPNGTGTSSVQHDYFLSLSCSPNSVASKEFALYFELEYF